MITINLEDYLEKGSRAFTSYDNGKKLSEELNINQSTENIQIIISKKIIIISKPFFLGLLSHKMRELGVTDFSKRIGIVTENRVIKENFTQAFQYIARSLN